MPRKSAVSGERRKQFIARVGQRSTPMHDRLGSDAVCVDARVTPSPTATFLSSMRAVPFALDPFRDGSEHQLRYRGRNHSISDVERSSMPRNVARPRCCGGWFNRSDMKGQRLARAARATCIVGRQSAYARGCGCWKAIHFARQDWAVSLRNGLYLFMTSSATPSSSPYSVLFAVILRLYQRVGAVMWRAQLRARSPSSYEPASRRPFYRRSPERHHLWLRRFPGWLATVDEPTLPTPKEKQTQKPTRSVVRNGITANPPHPTRKQRPPGKIRTSNCAQVLPTLR